MNIVNIVSWILFGLLVGTVANLLDPKPIKGGILGSIILGITGAITGGILASLIFGINMNDFDITSLFIAISGSLLLLTAGGWFLKGGEKYESQE